MCSWTYLLENNQVRQFVKFMILSTWCMHVHNLWTHDILKLFLTSTEKNFLFQIEKLYHTLVSWFFDYTGKFALWKLKNGSYFPNHDSLIPTLHLCQKYTIKRYCLKELQNYISCIIYVFIIFSGLSTCAFYLLFRETSFMLACVYNLFSVFHEFWIKYH